jgi:hypothetical protein
MRLASFAVITLAILAACDPDSQISPVTVQWMDWPADVPAGQPFAVRMVVSQPCAASGFREGTTADQSAITFEPYFLEARNDVMCIARASQAISIAIGALDTVGRAPGLAAPFSRTYEMRGAAGVYAAPNIGLAGLPVRTFGQVTARGDVWIYDPTKRNAGGMALVTTDQQGCARIRPVWTSQPDDAAPLDNQETPGPAPVFGSFVRGYYYTAPAPVCGETRVFHLVSVN